MKSAASLRGGTERETQEAMKRAASVAFEPSLVGWNEELERRRLAVARWRGLASDAGATQAEVRR